MRETTYSKLSKAEKTLLDAAEKAIKYSYSPYSGFKVGAALLTKHRQIIMAANVENSSYPMAMCAEMAAVAKANSLGVRKFEAIAVISKSKNHKNEVIAPCGACRQILSEFSRLAGNNLKVIMSDQKKKKIVIANIHELQPMAFGHEHLR